MAHTTEIVLPQSFVVLQGMQGDGMRNTIDSVPIVLTHHNETDSNTSSDDAGVVMVDFQAEGASLASSSGEHVSTTIITNHSSITIDHARSHVGQYQHASIGIESLDKHDYQYCHQYYSYFFLTTFDFGS
jgi:hypothetical protein